MSTISIEGSNLKYENINSLYTGRYTINNVSDEIINKIYEEGKVKLSELKEYLDETKIYTNAYFILKGNNGSAICAHKVHDDSVHKLDKQTIVI